MTRTPAGERIAVIDIGTNTLLLLVADITDTGQVVCVHEACEFGRLGQGLDATGRLHPDAVARSLAMLERYRGTIDDLGVTRVHPIGTQALREAVNAREFVDPAVTILGADIEIVAGEREAELAYRSVVQSIESVRGQCFVIADVGGGSTEIIASTSDGAAMAWCQSLPLGSVRLHERHIAGDPPTASELEAVCRDIDAHLARVDLPEGALLVASAGTATSIASMALAIPGYDHDAIHGYPLPRASLEAQIERLSRATSDERRTFVGLPPGRADVILAGAAIFARLAHRMESDALIINDCGIRWGVAFEMAAS